MQKVWMTKSGTESQSLWSRDGFSIYIAIKASILEGSQSLWSRDGFSMTLSNAASQQHLVAIPLEQGRFFNSEVCFSFFVFRLLEGGFPTFVICKKLGFIIRILLGIIMGCILAVF